VTDGPQDGEGNSIWDRLRRRKVVQWGLAYAAGTWGLLQGLQFLTEAFDWPSRVLKLGTVAALLGLPLAIALAWFRGERGAQRASRTELTVVTLLFLLGGGLFWYYQRSTPASDPLGPAASSLDPTATTPAADAGTSVAVLPFDNRSANADDAYFVDGIHDDILTQLSKVSALKVISRISVEQFRGTRLPIREIASQLGVRTILEGGVQRGGDRVRINVQLIDASTDAHLWAETYDRELTAENIFAIQSEVAQAIAGALKAALTQGEKARVEAVPTRNLEAWEAYQLGRQRMARRTPEGLREAQAFFEKAIGLDPKFARAYAGLADVHVLQYGYAGAPKQESMEKAERAAEQAMALDPNLAEAFASAGLIAATLGQAERAESMYRRAVSLDPNYAQARQWLAGLLDEEGRSQEAFQEYERALELDPLSLMLNQNIAMSLIELSRLDEAAARFRRIIEIDASFPLAYAGLAGLKAYDQGRVAEAIPFQEKAVSLSDSVMARCFLAGLYLDLGERARAATLLEPIGQRWPDAICDASTLSHLYKPGSPSAAEGDGSEVLRMARRVLESDPTNGAALALLRDADLATGHAESARARYAAAYPELVAGATPKIHFRNASIALDIVPVLLRTGAAGQATAVLDGLDEYRRKGPGQPRVERRFTDAVLLALRGDSAGALGALRDAQQAGWRGPGWRYVRDSDPAFDSIRNRPEFKAVFDEI
jgi:TolB-like protein/cytochrome c-type biogenesis protein CcmH/NrfG